MHVAMSRLGPDCALPVCGAGGPVRVRAARRHLWHRLQDEPGASALQECTHAHHGRLSSQFVASPGALTPAQCAALLASPKSLAAAGSIAAGSEEGSE